MRVALRWTGGLEDALALARLREAGREVALAPAPGATEVVPAFVLEDQAAALGLALEDAPAAEARADAVLPAMAPREAAREALRRGVRAFVVACRPPLDASFPGRFVDADLLEDAAARGADLAACRTLAVDGPFFLRRVEAVVGDVAPHGDGWRVHVGLRGC